ncbi:TPA: AbiH family protein, partial [Streptococcus suis]
MTEEVQKYVVVGNGFDLNLGIKSSYGDFVEYVTKEHKLVSPQEIYSLNSLFIQKFDGTQLNWSDFETEFENQIFLIESKNEPAERKRYEVDKLNASIQQLEDDFYYYLSEQYDFWKREALGRDNKIENVNPLYQNIFNNANVISFNYTPSLEDLGLYPHCEHFYRIHGSLERKNIIFGGGLVGHLSASVLETEGATVNDKLVRIKKDTFLSEEREQLLQNLHDEKAIELYILGHSVYGSDLDFLSLLLEKAQKIYLFYYDQDYQAKMQNLIKHFSRNMLEKIELVPFLDVVKRGGESYYFELDSENWEHQSYLQMFRDVFRVNIPRKQEFSKFWLSTSNFSIKDIQKIEIKDPVGLMNYEWFLSLFQVDDSRK